MSDLRYSRQREAILDFLCTRKDHPTAAVVYQNVRREYPNISLGTVYRNLTLLADLGKIQCLRLNDGTDHFDADTSEHYHCVCTECGRVLDLDMSPLGAINDMAARGFNGKITGHMVYFHGICENCITK